MWIRLEKWKPKKSEDPPPSHPPAISPSSPPLPPKRGGGGHNSWQYRLNSYKTFDDLDHPFNETRGHRSYPAWQRAARVKCDVSQRYTACMIVPFDVKCAGAQACCDALSAFSFSVLPLTSRQASYLREKPPKAHQQSLHHTPSIAFWYLPPNSARIGPNSARKGHSLCPHSCPPTLSAPSENKTVEAT